MNEKFRVHKDMFIAQSKTNIKQYYKFTKEIGQGAFGVVFLAKNKITDDQVAVKALAKEMIGNQEAFTREIAILRKLDHPNIVQLYEIFESETTIYIVMEYCSGGELLKHIANKQYLTEGETARIIRQCISSISYLHANNIVHRDLKPENFLLKNNDDATEIKLIDFGFSAKMSPNQSFQEILGTPLYIAPEILSGSYDYKVDCWSLGVIVYILLSGTAPFYGKDTKSILEAIKSQSYTFDKEPFYSCSDEVKDLISKLLQKKPKKRFTAEQAFQHQWVQLQVAKEIQDIQISPEVFKGLRKMIDMKNIKKTMLMFMATQIPENKLQDLKKIFFKIDQNGNGTISLDELIQGFAAEGPSKGIILTPQQLEQIFENMDFDQSGQIDYSEFIASFVDSLAYKNDKLLRMSFDKIDKDKNGKINREELQELLNTDTIVYGDSDIDKLIKEADLDGDGEINFHEFAILIRGKELKIDSEKQQ